MQYGKFFSVITLSGLLASSAAAQAPPLAATLLLYLMAQF